MSWYLYRLGRWAFRHRKGVLAAWLIALVLAGTGAATLSGKTSDNFSMPGLESVEAFDLMKERNPGAAADGATARLVFQAPEGSKVTDPTYAGVIGETVESLAAEDGVVSAVDPFEAGQVSPDETVAYTTVTYDTQSIDLSEAQIEALEEAPEAGREAGMTVEMGGDALMEIPETGASELIGIAVALVVLVITFGSLIAAGMPLLTALVGVGIGIAGITTLTGFVSLGSTTPILATMLGLAVGIDYALFIVSRYRHEVMIGREPEEAAGRAVGTAGSAVVFAGITVVIALAGLAVVNISLLTEMGLAAAATVAIAVLIALTLVPAIFGFAKKRIIKGKIPGLRQHDPEADDHSGAPAMGHRWAGFVSRRKAVVAVVGVLVAAVASIPVMSLQESLPDDGTAAKDTSQRKAYDMIADSFGAGANGPLLVVVDTREADDADAAVAATTEAIEGVETDIAAVVPGQAIPDADLATISVIPQSGPADAETQDLVADIRDAVAGIQDDTGAEVLVSGQTAVSVDVSEKLADALPVYLALVVGLAFILLILVFRSLLVPLSAVLGFLLTIGVALGATVAVFQWGWLSGLFGVDTPGPIISILPLLMVGILFGLAMDYQVFLVSRMREEYVHTGDAGTSVVTGFSHSARVVTAAAIIMISVFGSFIISPMAMIKPIGFGLAFGILADAFLVRMTLIPAFMAIAGKSAWWLPTWLDRLIPNLDIEGDQLTKRLERTPEEATV
ncbi:MMPL family transporter [Mumia zhuanghuii]|uniref:MMPL family transporter n=1 Tax=Mumia zhuanghuii TaxID=2585211 RepID=A0A5C4MPB7_9ACTN|nr:MMPL family transporter [Mumia zhuanghuii]TNC46459.1 MMPL family transporter [Mumia zhuanghuii]TNC47157.1 MMPL family transporter [Mumia zhuanghuii]